VAERSLDGRQIPIDQIRPDPAQPRKLLPPDLVEVLASGGSSFDILDQLRARAERDKWTRERMAELDALAYSIDEDGLMNPIRVIPDGDDCYRIEEGERRWWAHHILVQQGKEQFQTIPAFVVEPTSVSSGLLRRRVAENVLRSDFTAIELGRAMASRIQEILDAEPSTKRSEAERRVGKENGMSDRRVRQFVALLTLSPEAQELAQQARLTENSLRRIVGIKDSAKQLAAVRELMHPSQEKPVAHSPSKSSARRKPRHGLNRHAQRPTRSARLSAASPRRSRNPRRDARRRERQDDNSNATQKIQKVLMLAKALSAKDWSRAMKGTNRRAISHLHDVLGTALRGSNRRTKED
jgi:ParB/RepB/Spo0J family partition protein